MLKIDKKKQKKIQKKSKKTLDKILKMCYTIIVGRRGTFFFLNFSEVKKMTNKKDMILEIEIRLWSKPPKWWYRYLMITEERKIKVLRLYLERQTKATLTKILEGLWS